MADKDDRPGGVLEISPAVARDMEKAKEGKIPAPPIEAFMSDDMVNQIEDASAAKAQPVHAETLRPITRGEAQRRTTFDGTTLPSMPAPRRVVPPPFRRPSVSGGTHGKTWQNVRADQVGPGDILPDVGLVTSVGEDTEYWPMWRAVRGSTSDEPVAVAVRVKLTGAGGVERVFAPGLSLRVFRKA